MYPRNTPRSRSRTPPKRRMRRPVKSLLVVGLLVAGLFLLHHTTTHKSVLSAHSTAKPTQTTAQRQTALANMGSQINAVLAANPHVDISVAITDLRTNQTSYYGPTVAYEAASVAKLITAADFLHQVETGQKSLQTELEDGHTANYDLQQMIVMSDNNAWQSLTDELTLASLGTYSASIGINDYDLSNNTLQVGDIALLLQKLYTGQLLNASHTKQLLSYMKIANEAGFIPPVVPKDVPVYHKAGVLEDRIHDAAIVADPDNPLAIVIFTNGHGTYDTPTRTAAIQSITKSALGAYDIR